MTIIHLNDYTKAHLAQTVSSLWASFNTSSTSKAPVKAVVGIYDALLDALKVCRIDQGTRDYIVTMVRNHNQHERSLNQYVLKLKKDISASPNGMYPADFALRCLLAVLRDGEIKDPDDERPFYAKILGVGKMSDYERKQQEEELLEPVARNLSEMVLYYYQSRN